LNRVNGFVDVHVRPPTKESLIEERSQKHGSNGKREASPRAEMT
jgi:hypothetical protein